MTGGPPSPRRPKEAAALWTSENLVKFSVRAKLASNTVINRLEFDHCIHSNFDEKVSHDNFGLFK